MFRPVIFCVVIVVKASGKKLLNRPRIVLFILHFINAAFSIVVRDIVSGFLEIRSSGLSFIAHAKCDLQNDYQLAEIPPIQRINL